MSLAFTSLLSSFQVVPAMTVPSHILAVMLVMQLCGVVMRWLDCFVMWMICHT
jgi:hypothetical protein